MHTHREILDVIIMINHLEHNDVFFQQKQVSEVVKIVMSFRVRFAYNCI